MGVPRGIFIGLIGCHHSRDFAFGATIAEFLLVSLQAP